MQKVALMDSRCAPIAQLVEHLICNQRVCGSSPYGGTISQKVLMQWQASS